MSDEKIIEPIEDPIDLDVDPDPAYHEDDEDPDPAYDEEEEAAPAHPIPPGTQLPVAVIHANVGVIHQALTDAGKGSITNIMGAAACFLTAIRYVTFPTRLPLEKELGLLSDLFDFTRVGVLDATKAN